MSGRSINLYFKSNRRKTVAKVAVYKTIIKSKEVSEKGD